MLPHDIILLLIKQNPEIAYPLLSANRTFNRWITKDKVLMKYLVQHYQTQISEELNKQVARLFHIVLQGREIVNVHLTESYRNKKEYQLTFSNGIKTCENLNKLQTDLTNPQSRDAYQRIFRLHRRINSIKHFGKNDMTRQMEDICSGVKWVCKEQPKPQFSWRHFCYLFLLCELAMVVTLVSQRFRSGGMLAATIIIGITCYFLVHKGLV